MKQMNDFSGNFTIDDDKILSESSNPTSQNVKQEKQHIPEPV